MIRLFKLFLFFVFLVVNLEANTHRHNITKFSEARKNYAQIIGNNNKTKEIKYLKQLIWFGTKLKRNVSKYKKELKRLRTKATISTPKKYKPTLNKKYSITSVTHKKDQIIIKFNKRITKRDIHYFTKRTKRKHQYIFDFKGKFKDAKPTKLSLDNIDNVKIYQYRVNTLRITISNKYRIKPIYIIGKKTITIRATAKKRAKKKSTSSKSKAKLINKVQIIRKTIVIDAGHGGRDGGASGPHKRNEKTVTLKVAKYLYKELKQHGYRVYLTRDRDKYVRLINRTHLANKKNADIFISIHANSTVKSKVSTAHGLETYFLSPAKSARAKRVAAKENKGDMGNMSWGSQSTFLTVLNQGKITASNKMAIDIQKNMLYSLRQKYGTQKIRDGGVREGPFWVLVGAQMPSILIEVGYISHPSESKRIYTASYQKLIAKSISNGIDSYFMKNP